MITGYIYQLTCPIKKEPIYVGSTKVSIEVRFYQHKNKINTSDESMYVYFRKNKIIPTAHLVEMVSVKSVKKLRRIEKEWIKKFANLGYELFNSPRTYKEKQYGFVKIETKVIKKVKKAIKGTGVTIGAFFSKAALEKLNEIAANDSLH